MNDELSLALFVGSIFALISLYIAIFSVGTKLSFLVFHFFHFLIWSILMVSGCFYFETFRLRVFDIFNIDLVNSVILISPILNIPILFGFCIPIFYEEKPLFPSLAIIYSYLQISIPTTMLFLSSVICFTFQEHVGTFIFKFLYIVFMLLVSVISGFAFSRLVKAINGFSVKPESTSKAISK